MDVFSFIISFLGITIAAGLLLVVIVEFIIKQKLKKLDNAEKIILKILVTIHDFNKYPYKISNEQKTQYVVERLKKDRDVKINAQKLYSLVASIIEIM